MLGSNFVFFVAVVGYLCNSSVYADLNSEDLKKIDADLYPIYTNCMREYNVTSRSDYETVDPCMFACFLKKIEIIDNKGFFDVKKAMEMRKMYVTTETYATILDEIISVCEKVNVKEVSDGDKGCERFTLLRKCMREHSDII